MDGARLARAGLLAFAVAATGNALGWWQLQDWVGSLPSLCLIRGVTGHECPGCGMGRSLALLAQGHVLASLHQHPFALPFLLWLSGRALLPPRLIARVRAMWFARSNAPAAALIGVLLLWWLTAKVLSTPHPTAF